jgi:multicomponent Na+:H+ antiporter subunit B
VLKNFIILKTILGFIIAYIILYAVYIQLNGEDSPGGGFQAGVILATALIAFDLISGTNHKLRQYLSADNLLICSVIGVMIYAGTGVISFFSDDHYLNYNSISNNPITGQHLGIFMIEIGVGLTVASTMYLIYSLLRRS